MNLKHEIKSDDLKHNLKLVSCLRFEAQDLAVILISALASTAAQRVNVNVNGRLLLMDYGLSL